MAGLTHKRPRTTKHLGSKRPSLSAFWKQYWAQPGIREKRRADPHTYSRVGIPHRMGRDWCDRLIAKATQWADEWMKKLEDAGIVLTDGQIVPGSDDEIAKHSIREAAIIALSPGAKREKLIALNLCLQYTKQKPVSKIEAVTKSPEQWLREALEASKVDLSPLQKANDSDDDDKSPL